MGVQNSKRGLVRIWIVLSALWFIIAGAFTRIDVSFSRYLRFREIRDGSLVQPDSSTLTPRQWELLTTAEGRTLQDALPVFLEDLSFVALPSLILLIAMIGGLWIMNGVLDSQK